MIGYLLYYRPFKDENQQTMTVVNELMIVAVCCIYLFFVYSKMTATTRTNVGWVIVVLITIQAFANFAVVLYFGASKLSRKIRDMFGEDDY